MEENRASITSTVTAYSRAYHSKYDHPKIFDDFIAIRLFSKEELEFLEYNLAESAKFIDPGLAEACSDQACRLKLAMKFNAPTTLSRSRYTEDIVEEAIHQGMRQYVILGAGLDTFAFRRPDLAGKIKIFEVDHPATQAQKKDRLSNAGLVPAPQHYFIPVDLAQTSLAEALEASAFNRSEPVIFSWLGVTFYLSYEVVMNTFKAIAGISAPGSIVVFDFMDREAFVPGKASMHSKKIREIVKNAGEPMKMGFDVETLGSVLEEAGFQLREILTPGEIQKRYFQGRTDGYHAAEHIHFAYAAVR